MSYGALERNGEASHSSLNKLATRQASEERWLLARSAKVAGGADMLNGGSSSMTMTNEESVVAAQRRRTEEARMEMERSHEAIRKRTTETRGEAWKPAAAAAASRPSSAATGGAAAAAEANGGGSRWGEATTRRSVSMRDLDAAAAAGGEEEGEWVPPPPRRITQAALDELPLEESFSFSLNRPVAVRSPSPLPHRALGYMPRRSLSREVVARVSPPPPPPPPAPVRKPEEVRRPSPIVVQAESRRPSSARPSPARAESHSRRPTPAPAPAPAPDPAPALYAAMQQELRAARESMSTFTSQLKAMSTRIVELELSERRSTSQLSRSEARLAKLRERTAQLEAEVTALREASLTRFEETERNVDTLRTGAKAFREAVDRRFEAQLRGAAAASERKRPAPIQLPPPPPPHLPPPPPPPAEKDTSDQWAYGRSPPPAPEAHAEVAPAEEASSARLEEELRSRLLSLRRTRNSATASPLPEGEQQQQDGEADESLENLKGRVERSRARAKAFQEPCAQRDSDRKAAAEAEPLSAVESVQTLIMPPTSASAASESRNEGDESAPPTAATEGVEDPLEALRRRVAASRRAKAAQEASSSSPQPHASSSQRASLVRSREESTSMDASEAKRARTESAASLSSSQPTFVAPLAEASGSSSSAAAANVASPAASSSSRALDRSGAVGKVQWGTPVGLQETPLQGGEQFAPLVLAIRQLCGWPGFIARAALEPLKISRVQVVLQHIKPTILQGYNNDISFFIQKAQAYVAIELELSRAVPSNPRDTLRGASINLRDVHRPYYTQIVNGVPTLKMQIKLLCARAHISHEEYTNGQISWAAQAIPLRVAFSDEHFPFPFNLGPEWADTIGRPEFYFPFVDALRLHPNGALVSELQAQLRSWLGDEVMRGVAAGLGSFNHYIGAALLHVSLEYCSDIHANRVRLTQETFNAPFKTFEANQLYFANAAERMAAIEAARQRRETQQQALQPPPPPPPGPTSSAEAAQSNVIVESLFDGANNSVEQQQAQPYTWTPDSAQLDPSAPRIPIPGFPGL